MCTKYVQEREIERSPERERERERFRKQDEKAVQNELDKRNFNMCAISTYKYKITKIKY